LLASEKHAPAFVKLAICIVKIMAYPNIRAIRTPGNLRRDATRPLRSGNHSHSLKATRYLRAATNKITGGIKS
jgi:hypothetical protein